MSKRHDLSKNLEKINRVLNEIMSDRDSCRALIEIKTKNKGILMMEFEEKKLMSMNIKNKKKTKKSLLDNNASYLVKQIHELSKQKYAEKLKKEISQKNINKNDGKVIDDLNIVKQDSEFDFEYDIYLLDKIDKEIREFNELRTYLDSQIKISKYLKEAYKQDLESNNIEFEETKSKILDIKNDLMLHYHELLIDGRDSRSKGLTWIMIAIWNLGSEIFMSYMPSFLDPQLLEYLYLRSHKEIELGKCQELLEFMKNLVNSFRGINYRKEKMKNLKQFTKQEVIFLLLD